MLFDERYRIELRRLGAIVGGRMTDSAGFWDLAEFSGVTVHALDEDIVQLAERRRKRLDRRQQRAKPLSTSEGLFKRPILSPSHWSDMRRSSVFISVSNLF